MTGTIGAIGGPYITMSNVTKTDVNHGKVHSSRKLKLPVPTTSESVRRRKETLYPSVYNKG
jgi:hypothetical protein